MLMPMTFREWLAGCPDDWDVPGEIMEDGYAFYLENELGHTPTIRELKSYGEIKKLTIDDGDWY